MVLQKKRFLGTVFVLQICYTYLNYCFTGQKTAGDKIVFCLMSATASKSLSEASLLFLKPENFHLSLFSIPFCKITQNSSCLFFFFPKLLITLQQFSWGQNKLLPVTMLRKKRCFYLHWKTSCYLTTLVHGCVRQDSLGSNSGAQQKLEIFTELLISSNIMADESHMFEALICHLLMKKFRMNRRRHGSSCYIAANTVYQEAVLMSEGKMFDKL